MKIKVGTWHETKMRKLIAHTSYAADHIEHETIPGNYDIYIHFVGGYTIPMPQWLTFSIDSNVVSGGYYSGFGGVNYHFTPAQIGKSSYPVQLSAYNLDELVSEGNVTFDDDWKFLGIKHPHEAIKERSIDWEYLRQYAQ